MNLDEVVDGNKEYMEGIRKMVASQNGHKAKLKWIAGLEEYHLICTACGENFSLNHGLQLKDLIINVDGECDPGEILSVNVKDSIGTKDIFGGT